MANLGSHMLPCERPSYPKTYARIKHNHASRKLLLLVLRSLERPSHRGVTHGPSGQHLKQQQSDIRHREQNSPLTSTHSNLTSAAFKLATAVNKRMACIATTPPHS
jgi:hypothetical protein